MLFMVIERFKNGDAVAVYRRYRERGRMMPEGLKEAPIKCRSAALDDGVQRRGPALILCKQRD
jgi:hypothetical protein